MIDRRKAIIMLIVLGVVHTTLIAGDWPYWRGPDYIGVSAETDWNPTWPESGPKILWQAEVGTGFSSLVVAAGRVYTMGYADKKETVFCLDADTGKAVWTHSYAEPKGAKMYEGGPNATPTVAGDKVYTISKQGKVFCCDAGSGEVIWSRDIKKDYRLKAPMWGHAGSPLVLDGVVYLNAGSTGMALKADTGELVWKSGRGPAGYASVVPYTQGEQPALIVFGGTEVVGVLRSTGGILWRKKWRAGWKINAADPLVYGDTVFISSGYGKGCALLKPGSDSVTDVYSNKHMRNQCYGSVLYKDHVYGFDGQVKGGGKLTCLDLKSGQVQWTQTGFGTGTVMVAGDKLIILSEKGRLVIAQADPAAYKEIASAQVLNNKCWTVPAFAHGRIYVRDARGNVVCVDVRR